MRFSHLFIFLFLAVVTRAVAFDFACLEVMARASFTRLEDPFYSPAHAEFLRLYRNNPDFASWLTHEWRPGNLFGADPYEPEEVLAAYPGPGRTPRPALAARTVDLSNDAVLDRPSSELCHFCRIYLGSPFRPTEYYARVLSLREGDTVDFGNRRFRLGRFLGRGNSAQVFALADDPNNVIRIPFYTGPSSSFYPNYPAPEPLLAQHSRLFQRQFYGMLRGIPSSIRRVSVTEHDPQFRWLTVSRVTGTEDGKTFLERLSRQNVVSPAERNLRDSLRATVIAALQEGQRRWPNDPNMNWRDEAMIREAARQFVTDRTPTGEVWTLVDPN